MKTIKATIGEGGVLHVEGLSLEPGSRVEVKPVEESPLLTNEQWHAQLRELYGCLPEWDFDQFDRNYPEPIEPLFLSGEDPQL